MQKFKEFFILLILITIKYFVFYQNISDYNFLSITTLFTLSFALVLYLSTKDKKVWFYTIYLLISGLLLADMLYFRYFNTYASVHLFQNVTQVGEISSSIFELFKISDLLLFIDLPILVLLHYKKIIGHKIHMTTRYILLSIICLLLVEAYSYGDFQTLKSEFYYYHMNDFSLLENKEEDQDVSELPEIIIEEPVIKEHFGAGQGRNLIVIQVESLQDMVIGKFYNEKEITPFLNTLIEDSFYFSNYFQQLGKGNTSDAEFVTHNSIHAAISEITYEKYTDRDYYGLPWILKENGYETKAFHGYQSSFWNRINAYPSQGFDQFKFEEDYDLEDTIGFGLADLDFFEQSIEDLKALPSPFYAFMITLSNHHPYEMREEYRSIVLEPDSTFENYLNAVNYTDQALEVFINDLKENGLYDNSMIVIYGDHMGLNPHLDEGDLSDFVGREYRLDEGMNIPLIIHIPGYEDTSEITKVGGQIDFLPTILNLLGIEFNNAYTFGKDLLNLQGEGFVASQTYMLKGSFIQGDIIFNMARNGIFKDSTAWNRTTQEPVDLDLCREGYERAIKEINQSHTILKNNLMRAGIINQDQDMVYDHENQGLALLSYVASGGGSLENIKYTNVLQAFDHAYDLGYKWIEAEFSFTSDNIPVLMSSDQIIRKTLYPQMDETITYESFMGLDLIYDWTQLDLEGLTQWLDHHEQAMIVSNTKDDNKMLLSYIAKEYPDYKNRFIIQIYNFDEYIFATYKGFDHIIFSLDVSSYSKQEVIDFVKANPLLAIVISEDQVQGDFIQALDDLEIPLYLKVIRIEDVKANDYDGYFINEFE